MDEEHEAPLEGEIEPDLKLQVADWQSKLIQLASEPTDAQIRLPSNLQGRKVKREEIANAFLTSFELMGGVPRLAVWADKNYGDFMKIFGRLLPKETLTVHDGEVVFKHVVPTSPLDDEMGAPTPVEKEVGNG